MSVRIIGMDLPNSCEECPFCANDAREKDRYGPIHYWCRAIKGYHEIDAPVDKTRAHWPFKGRASFCPMRQEPPLGIH